MASMKQEEKALERTVHKMEAMAAQIQEEDRKAKIVSLEPKAEPEHGSQTGAGTSYGTCRYCGQYRQVDPCNSEEEANEQATLKCSCSEAMQYREALRKKERRRRALEDADQNLLDLFQKQVLSEDTLELMRKVAPLIYDEKVISVSFKLNYTVSAKLSRNSKGNIVIERKDAEAQKVEI